MPNQNQLVTHENVLSLNQAAATIAMLGVVGTGAWQFILAARQFDPANVPHSTADFREGRTTSALEKQLDQKLPVRKALIGSANSVRFLVTGGAGDQVRVGAQDWLFLTDELRFDMDGAANLNARADLMALTNQRLEKMGVKLVVALVPDKARIYPSHLIGGRYPAYNVTRYQDALIALRSRNISVVDLLGPLASGATSSQVYYRTDTHWNQAGARIAADTIAAVAKQMNIDWEITRFTTTTATEAIQRPGDLIRLMGLDEVPESFRPQADIEAPSETIQSTAANSNDLFGDSNISIALTGTSYSLRANFHGFLQQALSTKVLNAAKDGGGFLQATTNYLKDDAFRLAKPKLIIWEIPERFIRNRLEGEMNWLADVGLVP